MFVPFTARADTAAAPIGFGTLGGNTSEGIAVTNGEVVAGDSDLTGGSNHYAFLWTQTGGLVDLGSLGGSTAYSAAISADGSTVVGVSETTGNAAWHPFLWTQSGGMVDLGTMGGTGYSAANAISADGSVVVGEAGVSGSSGYTHAFRWTQTGGMVDLGTLGGHSSLGYGVSADGTVAVGRAYLSDNSTYHAFIWTQANGMTDMGTLGGTNSESFAVTDSSVVIGASQITGNSAFHAFRWTQAGGMADMGTLGGTNSYSESFSGDGSIIVGYSDMSGGGEHAFRWTQATGMQDLNTLLSNAGVNMSGITLNYAYGVSPNGKYITGQGTFPSYPSGDAYLACYDPSNGCVGVTTSADQQSSVQSLAAGERAAAAEAHSTASELLGMTRPTDGSDYMYQGAMFGSALGYVGGQYAARGVTVLGGFAYGAQDYPNIQQGNAPTIALAMRYTFDDPFGDEEEALHPYGEIGGWVTPSATLTLSRPYANGSGTNTGQGSTDATSWAEYGRGGLIWQATKVDQLTGYGELGQQYMNFGSYTESSVNNPFPASVDSGLFRMGVMRFGGSWTRDLSRTIYAPISVTLAGDVARSFDVHADLTADVPGVGNVTAASEADSWGEFGMRIETRFTERIALDLDVNGTTGGGALGTVLHGGAGLSYRF